MTQGDEESSNRLLINKKRVHNSKLVEDFLESEVYRELIQPDIDDMIAVSGASKDKDGFWRAGDIHRKDIDSEALKWLSGYQTALIELSMKLKAYLRDGKLAEREMAEAINDDEDYINPMEEDYEGD